MATEVLRPQDVLVGRFRVQSPPYARRRNFPAKGVPAALTLNQNQQRRPSTKHEKKRSAAEAKKPNHRGDRRRSSSSGGGGGALAMGSVTLLRRGESLDSLAAKIGSSKPSDPTRSDSELVVPLKVRRAAPQPKVDVYAGAAFDSSPSPRCLPRPSFCSVKGGASDPFEDDATRSLRRMLRLE